MKKRWQTKTLGQLCQLISGQHIDAKDYNTECRGVGYLTGPSDFGPRNPVISKWTETPKIKARAGDILITVKGSGVGKINVLEQDEVAISRQLMAVRVTDADPGFVHAFLISKLDHFQSLSTGAAIPGISRDQVLGLKVAAPSLPEQKRIVAILDEAFEGIDAAVANAEKNLANARELFESYLNSVFTHKGEGWVEKPLVGIAAINYGYTAKASFAGDGPKFLRITDIQDDSVDWSTVPTCPINNDEWKRHKLFDGDIVFARTGATTGKSYLLSSPPKSVAASYLIRCRLNDKEMLASFVALYFQTNAYWEHISKGTTGSAQGGFNASKLADLVIPKPPFSEQKRLVARFDALAAETKGLQAIYQQKLDSLAELKQSILQKAFAGELIAQPEQVLQEAVA